MVVLGVVWGWCVVVVGDRREEERGVCKHKTNFAGENKRLMYFPARPVHAAHVHMLARILF
jgi:hypothetical protein